MRRAIPTTFLPLALLFGAGLLVQGCVGMDNFIDNTLSTTANPNRPLGDSINMRRVQGQPATEEPVTAEGGNVWPAGVVALPTLQDLEGGAHTPAAPAMPAPRRSSAAPAQEPAPVIAAAPAPGAAREAAAAEAPLLPDLATQAPAGQRYRTVSTPSGTTVVAPNGDGSTTLMRADGSVTTVPAQR